MGSRARRGEAIEAAAGLGGAAPVLQHDALQTAGRLVGDCALEARTIGSQPVKIERERQQQLPAQPPMLEVCCWDTLRRASLSPGLADLAQHACDDK